jgi:hypothetical protein
MKHAQYLRGMYGRIGKDLEKSALRSTPVETSDSDPTDTLARLVFLYEPRDLRLDPAYSSTHYVDDTSTFWVKDVASGAKIRERNRFPGEGRLVVALDFHSNMAEFERYNSVVKVHNERWEAAGSPVDSFDSWSGDVTAVPDQYVDFATVDESMPLLGEGTGPLHNARPRAVHSAWVTVEYRASRAGSLWTFGFLARDRNGSALCWDETMGEDLAALVRRSVQMLYGNPDVIGNEGPLSDGMAMLLRGRKTGLCERKNTRPYWMSGAVKSSVSAAFVEAKAEQVVAQVGHTLFGYWVPIACIFGMLVWSVYCLDQTWGEGGPGPLAGFWWFFVGEVALCGISWLSTAISTWSIRAAEAADMRSTYL